eukprot:TRINITY_DN31178_c0_g1_i1.p1 TRINITY_DN31178_c0_g1~~TRINITY_DN31178_c0_g1_i1.p1  ORF type:complete len:169 (-),score=33.04 TRINITY_DN31178_c0_g1_i1:368-874(-)
MLFSRTGILARRAAQASLATGALGSAVTGFTVPVRCEGDKPSAQKISFGGVFPSTLEELKPVGASVSLGSLTGFVSGFTVKKIGKAAAVLFGGVYVLQQALAYNGYITINWPKVEKDLICVLDLNKDGKFDEKDFEHGYLYLYKVLQTNTAATSGGFGGGFLLGVRYG